MRLKIFFSFKTCCTTTLIKSLCSKTVLMYCNYFHSYWLNFDEIITVGIKL